MADEIRWHVRVTVDPEEYVTRLAHGLSLTSEESYRGRRRAIEVATAHLEAERNDLQPLGEHLTTILTELLADPQALLEYVAGSASVMTALLRHVAREQDMTPEEILQAAALNVGEPGHSEGPDSPPAG